MDLALTRRGDYAVRAALCLARRGGEGGYVKIREVAQTMALPASYTPQVLRLLAEAGLAEARAGRDGGYRLTRPPARPGRPPGGGGGGRGRVPAGALHPARRPLPLGAGLRRPRRLVGGGAGLPRVAGRDHPGRPGRGRHSAGDRRRYSRTGVTADLTCG